MKSIILFTYTARQTFQLFMIFNNERIHLEKECTEFTITILTVKPVRQFLNSKLLKNVTSQLFS